MEDECWVWMCGYLLKGVVCELEKVGDWWVGLEDVFYEFVCEVLCEVGDGCGGDEVEVLGEM